MLRKLFPIVLILLVMLLATVPALMLAQENTETPTAEGEATLVATEPIPEPTVIVVTPDPVETPPPVEEPPEETPVTEPQELLGLLFSLLKDATYIAWASAGVVVIVGLFKAVAGSVGWNITGTGAMLLTLIVQVIIWLGYAIANYFGAGEVFQKGYLIAVDIGRSLLPLAGSVFAGHVLYKAAAKRAVPVLGYRAIHANERVYKSVSVPESRPDKY